jgi:hypothetical protein
MYNSWRHDDRVSQRREDREEVKLIEVLVW